MKEFELGKNEIEKAAKAVLDMLPSGGIALLRGDLASGKTTLVKHMAKLCGIKEQDVSSPTFSVMNRYAFDFFHYDIYQTNLKGMMESGLFENLQEKGLHLIEWGGEELESVLRRYSLPFIIVEIGIISDKKRVYRIY